MHLSLSNVEHADDSESGTSVRRDNPVNKFFSVSQRFDCISNEIVCF